jgi:UDP-4-amino-4,6-dideoxy-N-acetyl-beta-L-altrosamine N-acetyltransferase
MLFNPLIKSSFCLKEYELWNYLHLSPTEYERLLHLRNHPEVIKWSFSGPITLQQHFNFLSLLKKSPTKAYWLVKDKGGNILGGVNLTRINWIKQEAYLGIFKNLYNPTKGIGQILLKILLEVSTDFLYLRKVYLEVFEENLKAINLYKRFGFNIEDFYSRNNRKVLIMSKNLK